MAAKNTYIQNLKYFQVDISRMEYMGNILSYSRPRMQKSWGIRNCFIADFYTDVPKKYTARGLYYQKAPFEQAMLISCRKGSAMMYFVDLRNTSATYLKYNCFRINAGVNARDYIYIPRGVAYGFVTLEDDTTIDFKIDNYISLENHEAFSMADPYFNFTVPYPDPSSPKERLSVLMAEDKLIISAKDKYAPWVSEFVNQDEFVMEEDENVGLSEVEEEEVGEEENVNEDNAEEEEKVEVLI